MNTESFRQRAAASNKKIQAQAPATNNNDNDNDNQNKGETLAKTPNPAASKPAKVVLMTVVKPNAHDFSGACFPSGVLGLQDAVSRMPELQRRLIKLLEADRKWVE